MRRITTFPRRTVAEPVLPESTTVERSLNRTVLRFLERGSLAGADLRLIDGLWDFLEKESSDPKSLVVIIGPPNLLGPPNIEPLLGTGYAESDLTASNDDFQSNLKQELALTKQLASPRWAG